MWIQLLNAVIKLSYLLFYLIILLLNLLLHLLQQLLPSSSILSYAVSYSFFHMLLICKITFVLQCFEKQFVYIDSYTIARI